jgi:hypothetical protein
VFGLRKSKRADGGQIAKIRSRRRRGKSLPPDASDGIEPHLKVKPSLKAGVISGLALRHPQDCQGKNLIPPALFRDASWQRYAEVFTYDSETDRLLSRQPTSSANPNVAPLH